MKKAILFTRDGLDLPCVILQEKPMFPIGKEALVYCQNRLVKGYVEDDNDYIAELNIVVEFCIIPELDEFLKDEPKSEVVCSVWY